MDIFTGAYIATMIIEIIIRAPINQKRKQEKMRERRVSSQEKILFGCYRSEASLYQLSMQ